MSDAQQYRLDWTKMRTRLMAEILFGRDAVCVWTWKRLMERTAVMWEDVR